MLKIFLKKLFQKKQKIFQFWTFSFLRFDIGENLDNEIEY